MSRDPLNEFNHAWDLMWDFKWKTRGFKGYPMLLRWATQYNFNRDTSIKTRIDLKDDVSVDLSTIHRLTPNLRFICAKRINISNLCHDPARSAFSLGTLLEFTL
jgi:hypothetical protein